MFPTPDLLFGSPDHYLHSFDGPNAVFVPMDRAAYRRSIFLDRRISPAPGTPFAMPAAALPARPAAPTAWIFHMAHCGSTLLARALDDPEASLVLREPLALRQTALAPDPARLALVLAMLGKRYRADAPTLVKANVPVNFLLPQIAAADPDARAILLHLPLRPYLLAILRSDQHRTWVRNVTGQLARYLGDLSQLSDAERAAALWLAQVEAFAGALAAMPNARTLDAEAFFAGPATALKAGARHLEVPIADAALDASVAGPLFATYSKDPTRAFDNAARVARNAELERAIAPELNAAEMWIAGRTVPALARGLI
ncbi:hypothetical protein OF829_03385 [Sphingomonas sp. LB-2]|uniref:hypothetical protein n=1 Tax=Sphingomonas caeni TaxID=2984949 RepID=UPI0022309A22|nr:hypothetical protein [Sphingomonas caeni]MCW3846268.1 hypothetical protein [Sphingomonas caeni]